MNEQPDIKEFYGGCPHDCPDTCSMLFKVQDGQLLSVRGNPDHPMTNGGLCVKLKDYEKRHYHQNRLLYPMRRTGPKGAKQFERITWEEALDEIVTRWRSIMDEYGPEAIIPYSYLGNQGLVHGLNGGDAFFNRLGATVCERTFCGEGSCTAWLLTLGPTGGLDPESYIHSKYIVIWACNSVSTNLHHWAIVKEAKKKGAKVVVIDAYRSRTAKEADWHLCPKPGTDGALAMAVINTLISEDLVDHDYIENYTHGFAELKGKSQPPHRRLGRRDNRHPGRGYPPVRKRARRLPTSRHPHRCRAGAPPWRWPDHPRRLRHTGPHRGLASCWRWHHTISGLGASL